ncbi:lipid asymmetry maintenance protein MlaB [Pseudomonadota bacterium]
MTDLCSIDEGEDGSAHLAGELTFESVPGLYQRSQAVMSRQPNSVDMSDVTTVDSAGLALLLEWQASLQDASERLKFTNAPSSLMSLASLCEATGLLNISGRDRVHE